MIDIEAIEALYIERSDSLDASSYDITGLCAEIRALRARLTPRTDSAPVNRPFLALRDKSNGCGKEWWIVRWDEDGGCFDSVPGGYWVGAVTTWMDLPEVTP